MPLDDYSRFLSQRSAAWRPSSIRGLFHLEKPGVISFLAGKPSLATTAISGITIDVEGHGSVRLDDELLTQALSYTATIGLPRLRSWYNGMLKEVHGKGFDDTSTTTAHVGSGSSDLLNKLYLALLDVGDSIVVESPVYALAESLLRINPEEGGVDILEAESDGEGLVPDRLEAVLAEAKRVGKKVKALYTCPTGSNPAGSTISEVRRRRVLELVEEYDILLIEDDPYVFLSYGDQPRPPSYFSLDSNGRVLRLDSLSKILAAGLRLGFVVGPKQILDRIESYSGNTNLQPSSTSQAIAIAVLEKIDFQKHARRTAAYYKQQRDAFEAAARRELSNVCTWTTPQAGMFLWLEINGIADSYALIMEKALAKGVLGCPGAAFTHNRKSAGIRLSFSLATAQQAEEAFPRLRQLILEAQAASKDNVEQ